MVGRRMNIKTTMVGKGVVLKLGEYYVELTESDVRRLRAELNRMLQRIAEKRRVKT